MNPENWQSIRHMFVWVDPPAWAQYCVRFPGRYPADWALAKRPLIVRRPAPGDAQAEVPLGLPLPDKRRLALTLPQSVIVSVQPPPLLSSVQHAAPPAWRSAIAELIAFDPLVRVFGSLAWSAMTGLAYLSATSDLDLLFELGDDARETLDRLSRLVEMERTLPMRIDGECVRADGLAVNWRELVSREPHVLVKSFGPPRLMSRDVFLSSDPLSTVNGTRIRFKEAEA